MSAEASISVRRRVVSRVSAGALLDIQFLFAIQALGFLGAERAICAANAPTAAATGIWDRAQHNVVAAIFGKDGRVRHRLRTAAGTDT